MNTPSGILLGIFMVAALSLSVSSKLVNVEVRRVLDVSSTVVISRTTMLLKNTGSEPAHSFFISVHRSDAKSLGDLWVTYAGSQKPFRALPLEPATDVPGLDSCCSGYKVILPKPIGPGSQQGFDMRMDVFNRIEPVPEVIEGHDDQYMRFSGSSYFFTPYVTEVMSTSITLGSSVITSKQGVEMPYDLSGKKLILGPYQDVAPLSKKDISIRFKNNRGFLIAKRAVKDFYLNHLGVIAVKEEYDVTNGGARHEGEWSRVDHGSSMGSKYGGVMGDVWANLPGDSTHVEYKDLIGNVTSSKLREAVKGKRQLQLVYRYPLMGGWNNLFWITYELILKNYMTSKENYHEIKLPLFPSLNTDMLCREYLVRVFLPEWSHSHKVVAHESLKMSVKKSSERTTLTMLGRPVFTIGIKMLRSQSKHAKTITLKYRYNEKLAWITPAIVAFGIILLFIGVILSVKSALNVDSMVDESGALKTKEKSQ